VLSQAFQSATAFPPAGRQGGCRSNAPSLLRGGRGHIRFLPWRDLEGQNMARTHALLCSRRGLPFPSPVRMSGKDLSEVSIRMSREELKWCGCVIQGAPLPFPLGFHFEGLCAIRISKNDQPKRVGSYGQLFRITAQQTRVNFVARQQRASSWDLPIFLLAS
jgi:hypothetical protein